MLWLIVIIDFILAAILLWLVVLPLLLLLWMVVIMHDLPEHLRPQGPILGFLEVMQRFTMRTWTGPRLQCFGAQYSDPRDCGGRDLRN